MPALMRLRSSSRPTSSSRSGRSQLPSVATPATPSRRPLRESCSVAISLPPGRFLHQIRRVAFVARVQRHLPSVPPTQTDHHVDAAERRPLRQQRRAGQHHRVVRRVGQPPVLLPVIVRAVVVGAVCAVARVVGSDRQGDVREIEYARRLRARSFGNKPQCRLGAVFERFTFVYRCWSPKQ